MNPRTCFRRVAGAVLVLTAVCSVSARGDDTPQEVANKRLVLDFYADIDKLSAAGTLKDQAAALAEKYIAPDYIQHQEGARSGREAFVQTTKAMSGGPAPIVLPPARLLALMADGDKVIQVTARDFPDPATGKVKPALIWNMFRIANGQLAEHWDALPPMLPMPPKP